MTSKPYSYKKLDVWHKSMDLVEMVYNLTKTFPADERFGLTMQINRCCISIPSNISEGQRRFHKKEKLHFYRIAFSSGAELETQLLIAERINFIKSYNQSKINNLLTDVMKMLNKLSYPNKVLTSR